MKMHRMHEFFPNDQLGQFIRQDFSRLDQKSAPIAPEWGRAHSPAEDIYCKHFGSYLAAFQAFKQLLAMSKHFASTYTLAGQKLCLLSRPIAKPCKTLSP